MGIKRDNVSGSHNRQVSMPLRIAIGAAGAPSLVVASPQGVTVAKAATGKLKVTLDKIYPRALACVCTIGKLGATAPFPDVVTPDLTNVSVDGTMFLWTGIPTADASGASATAPIVVAAADLASGREIDVILTLSEADAN